MSKRPLDFSGATPLVGGRSRKPGVDLYKLADEEGVPRELVRGIKGAEGPSSVTSPAGAMGDLQVIPSTGLRYVSAQEWNTPEGKARAGVRYLRDLVDEFGIDNADQIASAYHAGEGAVRAAVKRGKRLPHTEDKAVSRARGRPFYTDTDYVPRFMSAYKRPDTSGLNFSAQQGGVTPQQRNDLKGTLGAYFGQRPSRGQQPTPKGSGQVESSGIKGLPEMPQPVPSRMTGSTGPSVPAPYTPSKYKPSSTTEDTMMYFINGVTSAYGRIAKDVGTLAELADATIDPISTYKYLKGTKKPSPFASTITGAGQSVLDNTSKFDVEYASPTTAGQFRQQFAQGTGVALVELPKLMAGGRFLGAANLPAQMGLSGYTEDGTRGLVRGAAGGAVYHYGGQFTGKYLSKLGTTLFWIGAPAAEDHLINGTPLPAALGRSLPLGLFQGVGPQRAMVRDPVTGVRAAKLRDIPKIQSGKLSILEPEQVVMWKQYQKATQQLQRSEFFGRVKEAAKEEINRLRTEQRGSWSREPVKKKPEPYFGIYDNRRDTIYGDKDTPARSSLHADIPGLAGTERWRYEPKTKTVYWSGDAPPERGTQFALENWLDRRGQEVVKHDILAKYKVRDFREEGGFVGTEGDTPAVAPINRFPKQDYPGLISMGAFHYARGARTFDAWLGGMYEGLSKITERQEGPGTLSPEAMRQLGEVYAQSKLTYEEHRSPTFYSGLKQTIVELHAGRKIGDTVKVDRLINLLKQQGQTAELENSGLLTELSLKKKEPLKLIDLLNWLDDKGMSMDVLRGGSPDNPYKSIGYIATSTRTGWDVRDIPTGRVVASYNSEAEARHAATQLSKEQATELKTLPGVSTRVGYKEPGGRDYFEGVVTSNKALPYDADEVHMGVRPDQLSWYRGQVLGDAVKLEEVQSKRAREAAEKGVTEDPNNEHARLIALRQESDLTWTELNEVKSRLGKETGFDDETDQYYRYAPEDLDPGTAADQRRAVVLNSKLDKLNESIQELEFALTRRNGDAVPVPYAPHLNTWYEPALKGFLREAAERLTPDADGNVRVVSTSASEQAERYSLRKVVDTIEWTRNEPLNEEQVTEHKRTVGLYNQEFGTKYAENPTARPLSWDVQVTFQKSVRSTPEAIPNLTEKQLHAYFGKEVAERIVGDKYDYALNPKNHSVIYKVTEENRPGVNEEDYFYGLNTHGLKAENLSIGGDWAVKLYGDTRENIARLWPNRPELLTYAWGESGNKAVVPAWLEKYFRVWGGSVGVREEVSQQPDPEGRRQDSPAQSSRFTATMPEQMRDAILHHGQLFFGRRLAPLPKGDPAFADLRSGQFTRSSYEEHVQKLKEKLRYVYNPVTGQRVVDPRRKEGGFVTLGKKPEPVLDPRASTDLATRVDDPDTRGLLTRITRNHWLSSPVRRMLSYNDPKIDAIEERIYDAKTVSKDHIIEFERRFASIIDEVESSVSPTLSRGGRKRGRTQRFSDFVDLIEKEFADDTRRSDTPAIQRALEEHDRLTFDMKKYLMDSYEARGYIIKDPETGRKLTPDEWGITAQGFFKHLYSGENNIFVDGEFFGNHSEYADAVVASNKVLETHPDAKVEIRQRPFVFIDPSVRVSTRNYERLVQDLVGGLNERGEVTTNAREVREALGGKVGKKENINKFFGSTLKRQYGQKEGMSKDYQRVMNTYMFQLVRSQELSKLRKDIQPQMEQLKREGLHGEVENMERHLDDLWGKPLRYERDLSNMMDKVPGLMPTLRATIRLDEANQALAFQGVIRKIAVMHNFLKLRMNPKAIFVNDIQPLRTLWPYLTTKDMLQVVKRMHNKSWKQEMAELGVAAGTTKLETGQATIQRTTLSGAAKKFDFFTYVSGLNRQRGYTAGIIIGEREGLTGFELYKRGLRWADQVEHDNSAWNAPQVLRHSAGQLFGQYKGFLIKDAENAIDVFAKYSPWREKRLGLGPDVPWRTRPARVGKWLAGTAIGGGTKAALSPYPWLATAAGLSIYIQTAALVQALTGTDEETAKFYAGMVFLGPPSGAGLDLSSSLTPIDEPPGFTGWEKFGRFLGGPTVSMGVDLFSEGRKIAAPSERDQRPLGERVAAGAAKVTPYYRMGQRTYQFGSSFTGQKQYTWIDQKPQALTRTQMLFGSFGVPPSNAALYYEEKEAKGKEPASSPGVRPRAPFAPIPLSRYRIKERRY